MLFIYLSIHFFVLMDHYISLYLLSLYMYLSIYLSICLSIFTFLFINGHLFVLDIWSPNPSPCYSRKKPILPSQVFILIEFSALSCLFIDGRGLSGGIYLFIDGRGGVSGGLYLKYEINMRFFYHILVCFVMCYLIKTILYF